jgi:hypothetical protein
MYAYLCEYTSMYPNTGEYPCMYTIRQEHTSIYPYTSEYDCMYQWIWIILSHKDKYLCIYVYTDECICIGGDI